MKVIIIDKRSSSFKALGRMDAVPGMRSTSGNEIKSVNGESCQVMIEGRLQRRTEVIIDITTAVEFGWAASDQKPARAKAARKRGASTAQPAAPPAKLKKTRRKTSAG